LYICSVFKDQERFASPLLRSNILSGNIALSYNTIILKLCQQYAHFLQLFSSYDGAAPGRTLDILNHNLKCDSNNMIYNFHFL